MFQLNKDAKKDCQTSRNSSTGAEAKKSASSLGVKAMIGPGVKIEGQIVSDEDLIIEGKVDGSISAKSHEVVVGKSGVLKANIKAKVVKIEGAVTGDISGIEKVVIANTGNVLGNIDSPRVTLEDGAKFKGSIEMDPGEQAISELPTTSPNAVKAQFVGGDSEQAKAS
jgi:cytoskeletal protein CcmA (bactofilin family)